jgi:phosphopantetheinyl transferase (holo-ACP synthase)
LVGNDVVDLCEPDALPGARHPRFDARVFRADELGQIASSEVPMRMRWKLWAAKEAAYKLARKRDSRCVFSPVRFVVKLSGAAGVVEHGTERFAVRVVDVAGFVHVVATDGAVPADRLCVGVKELSEGARRDPAGPSRAVREFAMSRVRSRFAEAGDVTVSRRGRVPVLEVGGTRASADLSLSHHGRWIAFACELPRPDVASR